MSARYIKISLWIVALIGAWELGRSYVVTNAVFLFAADGVIPGTNRRLDPDQVFLLLGALLAVALLLIFSTNLRRVFLFWFGRQSAKLELKEPAPAKTRQAAKVTKPKPIVVIVLPKQQGMLSRFGHYVAVSFIVISTLLAAYARRHFPRFIMAAKRSGLWIWSKLYRVCRHAIRYMSGARQRVRSYVIRVSIMIARRVVRLWLWLEPYLREFDRWLGLQYHQGLDVARKNDSVKASIHIIQEVRKVTATWRSEIQAVLARVVEK